MTQQDLLGVELYDAEELGLDPFLEEEEEQTPEQLRAEEIQETVRRALERAISHHDENIEPDLVKATDYYLGRPFGDEESGRSKVVSTDVGDATRAQMPSLLRVFCGNENAVEFRARGEGDEPTAEQATDYVNYIIREDNQGFLLFYSAFKDALARRLGVFKWWWDERVSVKAAEYSGLGEMELMGLMSDPEVEDVEILGTEEGAPEDPSGGQDPNAQPAPQQLYRARATRREKTGRVRVVAVPPEEFVFSPEARDLESAPLVAHVREVPQSDLIAMGIDAAVVKDNLGGRRYTSSDDLEDARQIHRGGVARVGREDATDESQRPVVYAEVYTLVDADGDGISELRMMQCVGERWTIVNGDGLGVIVDEVPFAVITPEPEPHAIIGLSNYDLLKDVQRVKSQILRGTLNSLSQAVEPKLEVVSGEVNMADVLEPDISGVIRVTRPGQLREIKHSFVGVDTLPMLEYYDRVKEDRTGQTRAAQGLDADSLQSSTKAAVAATLSASQQRVEVIARVFAETGIARLFRGVLRLIVRHQDQARVIRLRGKYVQIDPRHWDATMDVLVNVGLGQGTDEDKLQILSGIAEKQEQLLQHGSPLVTHVEYRHTLAKMVELAGFRNADAFFRPWGAEQEQAYQQHQQQNPPPPDPAQALVELEQMKAQMQAQLDQAKLQLEELKMRMQDDRERDKVARETELKRAEIEAKLQTQVHLAQFRANVEADRRQMDEDLRAQEAERAAQAQAQAEEQQMMEQMQQMEQEQMQQMEQMPMEQGMDQGMGQGMDPGMGV
jgi:hypothetical protein